MAPKKKVEGDGTETAGKVKKAPPPKPVPTRYHVKLEFTDRIDGGIPQNKDLIRTWVETNLKKKSNGKAPAAAVDELTREHEETAIATTAEEIEAELEKMTTTFHVNDKGEPCLEARCIKAMIRQTASVMGLQSALPGLYEMLKEGLIVGPKLIPLAKDTASIEVEVVPTQPDKGPGAQSALKRVKFIKGATLEFDIEIIDRDAIAAYWFFKFRGEHGGKTRKGVSTVPEELLHDILEVGGRFLRLGGNRSQGRGEFILTELTRTAGNGIQMATAEEAGDPNPVNVAMPRLDGSA